MGWLSNRLPAAVAVWLINEVPACRVLPRRGSKEVRRRSEIRHARRGHLQRNGKGEPVVAAGMIGVDPHKGSPTAGAIGAAEEPLGQVRVRASAAQAERLLGWAAAWPQRTWAVEGAAGLGRLLAQELLSAGERVLDVQPKLGARGRLLDGRDTNKNDPNDARSVAVAALRSPGVREAVPDDHAAVLKIWSKRRRALASGRTQGVC